MNHQLFVMLFFLTYNEDTWKIFILYISLYTDTCQCFNNTNTNHHPTAVSLKQFKLNWLSVQEEIFFTPASSHGQDLSCQVKQLSSTIILSSGINWSPWDYGKIKIKNWDKSKFCKDEQINLKVWSITESQEKRC